MASDPMEFRGLLARAEPSRRAALSLDWARQARLCGHDVLLAANGVGERRAAAAVDAACEAFAADAVVSTGFCGALDPEFSAADVVVGTCIAAADRRYPALPVTSATAYRTGVICSIDHIARTAAEKRALRASGASAVEMEAAGVAVAAQARGLPFYCVRAVTDLAGEDLANDFRAALRPDGHFATMLILGSTLRHPWLRAAELFRLRNRCARAAHILGDFFANCRFRP